MADVVSIDQLVDAVSEQTSLYHKELIEKINKLGDDSVKKIAKITRATAPVGKHTPHFKDSIATKVLENRPRGNVYAWYVKPPNHRLTHLIANGHETKNGGRTRKNPFLENALNEVLPDYEKKVEEACGDG